jgi:SAM-dependent methyltransferase
MSVDRHTSDGSPVALYLRLSGEREAALIDAQLRSGSSILGLGCGAGRLTHEFVRSGHRVTAVDNSPDMLTHVRGAETVCADIADLDLGRSFDAVVLWSHLINHVDNTVRNALVAACRRHVSDDGVVLIWRHEPGWVRTVETSRTENDSGIVTELGSIVHDGDHLFATVAWEFDGGRYEQAFEAVDVDDAAIEELAGRHGLVVAGVFDPEGMLVRLEVAR